MDSANIALLLNVLLSALSKLSEISTLINNARAEGRDVSMEELDALDVKDDVARAALVAAIAKAKADAVGTPGS